MQDLASSAREAILNITLLAKKERKEYDKD
jgi:hypothetical protein